MNAYCCFCGHTLVVSSEVHLRIQLDSEPEAAQEICAHRACLRERVIPGIVLLHELQDDRHEPTPNDRVPG